MVRDHWGGYSAGGDVGTLTLRSVLAVLYLLGSVLPSSETAGILASVPTGSFWNSTPKAPSDCLLYTTSSHC